MFLRIFIFLISLQCYHCGAPTCGKHEVYQSCGTACQPYCDDRGPHCADKCVSGCFCATGYNRKYKDGPCIKIDDCESCNGDPNARPGCGNPCGHTCGDVGKPPPGCSQSCRSDGCDCIRGYVIDTTINKCVKPSDCPPVCGVNETYSQNPVICPPQTCDAIGGAFSCPAHTTSDTPACVCKDGYYRNKDNDCVLEADCDSCDGDSNARPGCGDCRTCVDREPSDCPDSDDCDNKCNCAEGYLLNIDTNKCVRPYDCPYS